MILILSTPRDTDTQIVIDYLKFNNANFYRLNDEDIMSGEVRLNVNPYDLSNSFFHIKEEKIYFKNIDIVWMRKFGFLKTYEDYFGKKNDITRYLYSEFSEIRALILKLLEDKKWLFKRSNMLTKIEILNLAKIEGLKVPNSVITSNKKDLERFFIDNNMLIISKSIGNGKHVEFQNKNYPFYTQLIKTLEKVTDKFSPSLFQEYIDKKV